MADVSPREFTRWHADPLGVVGRAIARRYRITGCLTTGGLGAIYLAVDGTTEVVVKLMTGPENPDAVLRFEREVDSLSRVQHPNVIRIHDHGRCADTGLLYIVTEWIPGVTLKRHLKLSGPCRQGEFEDLAVQILDGMIAAHQKQVIHRDLKSSNVMISPRPDGTLHVTLLDFGLSKTTELDDPDTQTHVLVGSLMTIAPEQLRGEPTDSRADVYALGVLFYRMLTGKRPYPGRDPAAVFQQQETGAHIPMGEALGPAHHLPRELVALVDRCLSADPADRPRDAGELRRELDRALGTPTPAPTRVWTGGILLGLLGVVVTSCAYVV